MTNSSPQSVMPEAPDHPEHDDPTIGAPERVRRRTASTIDVRGSEADHRPRSTGPPIIRLVDVSKSFGSLRVLDHVNLDFKRGQITVVIGPSGTGKSVLLKHIVGLLKPDSGQVYFNDQRIDTMKPAELVEVRRKIGFLFQMGALFDSLTVGQNVAFPLVEHTTMSHEERMQRVKHVLALVGLPDTESKMPAALSGGQKKRVALARAIVMKPEMVLYDEPTTGLDPIRADLINELIVGLSCSLGITSIVVTHDMTSAAKIADRLVLLYDGHVVADGDWEAFQNNDNDLVQRFIHGQADQAELDSVRGVLQEAGDEAVR